MESKNICTVYTIAGNFWIYEQIKLSRMYLLLHAADISGQSPYFVTT